MTDVAWIGVGAMGLPMVTRLAAEPHKIRAFDANPARCDGLTELGIEVAASAVAAAEGAELLVLMAATPQQCESVLFGADELDGPVQRGAASALRPDATVVVMATVGPEAVEKWARRLLEDGGVAMVDAPVSGGVARAARGELLTMVGAAAPELAKVRWLLDALSARVALVGPGVGDGQRMKLVNQLLCGVHIAVAAEALGFAEALGLDAGAAYEVVTQGAAASFMLEDRGARMVSGAFDDVHSALDIFVKDMGLVAHAAHAATYSAPIAIAAEQLYLAAQRAGLGRLDDSAVIELVRGTVARG
ncbi:MAG: NAD(P)-dependent oxidoreductase [Acidimicrobiales bacterium]|jgi:3-hydroxyisobutyrate dehydrogenase